MRCWEVLRLTKNMRLQVNGPFYLYTTYTYIILPPSRVHLPAGPDTNVKIKMNKVGKMVIKYEKE